MMQKPKDRVLKAHENEFKLFFDERLTWKQAQQMLTFANNGSYIDRNTSRVEVRFVTYNRPYDLFCLSRITFEWKVGGKISWEYKISPVVLKPASSFTHFFACLVAVCLVINTVMELGEVAMASRRFHLRDYVCDFFNWIDWIHIIVMWVTASYYLQVQSKNTASFLLFVSDVRFVILCIQLWVLVGGFKMQARYPVLFYGPHYKGFENNMSSSTSVTKPAVARMFRTNAVHEFRFLTFLNEMEDISSTFELYTVWSGVALLMFLFRVLKSLDFQERMGLVTRTINAAASDLIHFIVLFSLVFLGYACTGNLLFGHLLEGMSTVQKAMETLFMILMDFDSSKFAPPMKKAAGETAFNVFLWSYIVVSFFILMNMLLAIIVDSYAHVKEETQGTTDLVTDILDVAWHGFRRITSVGQKNHFVSDQTFLAALKEELRLMKSDDYAKQRIEAQGVVEVLCILICRS